MARSASIPTFACGAVIAAAAIAAYGRTFSSPLVFDDIDAIANNASIRHLSTALWSAADTTVYGRPILNLSLALNYAISGTAVWSYHAVNLLIHVLAGLTLFGIVRRTMDRKSSMGVPPMSSGEHGRDAHATSIAFAIALLWTLHPLQTESVTYVVQRAESLMGLFYLLTLYCFIRCTTWRDDLRVVRFDPKAGRHGGRPSIFWFVAMVTFCLLGMATKEVMVSAPVIVFLYDRTFVSGSFREAWRRRRGFYLALAATWIPLGWFVIKAGGNRGGHSAFGSGVSWWRYELTQFPAIVHYLRLSVWPHPLVFDYGTEWVRNGWAVVPYAVAVMGLVAATVWASLRPVGNGGATSVSPSATDPADTEVGPPFQMFRLLSFAGVFFFAILAPTSLVPGNRQTAAEHRMYLALIPVVVLAVVGIYRWLGRGALPVCLALAVGLFALTFQRNEDYRSALSLWSGTVAHRPDNPYAHNYLGAALAATPGRVNEGIAEFAEAVRLKPDYAEGHNNLGAALVKLPGRLNDSIVQYQEALRLNPRFAEAHYNLGCAFAAEGRTPEAVTQYAEALRLNPDYAEAHNNLGIVFAGEGRKTEAIDQFEAALRMKPDNAEAHSNLGITLGAEGRMPEAIAQYEEAVRLKPDDGAIQFNLAVALLRIPGRIDEAVVHLETAVRLQPENDRARQLLAQIRGARR